ncbi:hypothetical protein MM236_19165 [Belliella sp. DSM 107340]|uniref:PRTRC system protein E n=1 Tax=Belliella calami TaxID=2923436 RepID=A0ABS9UU34_9BACT|nr:hypothetical protein [Belliella calami]MCH7400124.1 hypothetical protein [Belliella calami]
MGKISKELETKVRLIFRSYPKAKEFHFTSDGQAFSLESDAKNHAKTLKAKEVTKITRQMVVSGNFELDTTVYDEKVVQETSAGNEFQASGAKGEKGLNDQIGKAAEDEERKTLIEKFTELEGKKPAHNIGTDKLKAAVEELEKAAKEAAEKADKDSDSEKGSDDQKDTENQKPE